MEIDTTVVRDVKELVPPKVSVAVVKSPAPTLSDDVPPVFGRCKAVVPVMVKEFVPLIFKVLAPLTDVGQVKEEQVAVVSTVSVMEFPITQVSETSGT